ncbi:hypothetical protein KDA23_03855 [Candidatus Saccharibacteria bacterium]|nr:hypothetical protein [Candidatus Saccharibacteria bacterium]
MNDEQALQKLHDYMSSGKSYFDAVTMLKQEGFTQLQIDNATAAFRSGKTSTEFNPVLADSLNKVAATEMKDKESKGKNEGIFMSPGGSLPMTKLGGRLRSWWYLLPFGLVIAGMAYYLITHG